MMFNFNFKESICAVSKGIAIGSILSLILNHYDVPKMLHNYVQNMQIKSDVEMLDKSLKNAENVKYKINPDTVGYREKVV